MRIVSGVNMTVYETLHCHLSYESSESFTLQIQERFDSFEFSVECTHWL